MPFIVLKAMALKDRLEPKDAYDLVYCLHLDDGPASVATKFALALRALPDDPLIPQAVEILREHFATDERVPGARKDGPTQYALFLTNPGQAIEILNRRDAAATVEAFLAYLARLLAA